MGSRRLSQRQRERIAKIQERRRNRLADRVENALDEIDETTALEGQVIVQHGQSSLVRDETGQTILCSTRRNIGKPVCGDRVVLHRTAEDHGIISALLARHTVLSRPDYSGRDKALAANISQLVIVIAVEPEPHDYLVDQYLIAAESIGVKAVILLNKSDLLDSTADAGKSIDSLLKRYADIGYETIRISSKVQGGVEPLLTALYNETSILVGQSGVGKSSLAKKLLPENDIEIGAISEITGRGKHTTSASTLYQLPFGGQLIDSPGVRSFRLSEPNKEILENGFRDIKPYLGRCKFNNCSHRHEPGCALREAFENGKIRPERFNNFLHMLSTLVG